MATLMALVVGFFLWDGIQTQSVQAIRSHIDHWQPILTGIRWSLIGTLALCWPQLCRWWVQARDLNSHNAQRIAALRWRIVGWLVAIELILGQGALIKAISIITGMPG